MHLDERGEDLLLIIRNISIGRNSIIFAGVAPGDGHGICFGNGPGITESDGMFVLVNWVEGGHAPGVLRVVQVKRLGDKTI